MHIEVVLICFWIDDGKSNIVNLLNWGLRAIVSSFLCAYGQGEGTNGKNGERIKF